jgi:hypothetical protein
LDPEASIVEVIAGAIAEESWPTAYSESAQQSLRQRAGAAYGAAVAGFVRPTQVEVHAPAHELWTAAQLVPGERIEDGAQRIATLLGPLLTTSACVPSNSTAASCNSVPFEIEAATEGQLVAYEAAAHQMCAAVMAVLDGRDTGAGSNHEPWGTVRRRLVDLVRSTPRADAGETEGDAEEHPGARRMRDRLEEKYGEMQQVASLLHHYYITRRDLDANWNRQRERPLTEDDVGAAEQAVFAAVRSLPQFARSAPLLVADTNPADVDAAEQLAFASSNQSAGLHRHWFRNGYQMGVEARPSRGLSIEAFNPIWYESDFDDATEEAFARGVALLRQIEAALNIPSPVDADHTQKTRTDAIFR